MTCTHPVDQLMPSVDYKGMLYCRKCEMRFEEKNGWYVEWKPEEKGGCICQCEKGRLCFKKHTNCEECKAFYQKAKEECEHTKLRELCSHADVCSNCYAEVPKKANQGGRIVFPEGIEAGELLRLMEKANELLEAQKPSEEERWNALLDLLSEAHYIEKVQGFWERRKIFFTDSIDEFRKKFL